MDPRKEQIAQLAQALAQRMGMSSLDAIVFALKSALASRSHENFSDETPIQILASAKALVMEQGGFTLDELLGAIYGNTPVFAPHGLKMIASQILRANGYKSKQVRRGQARPICWYKPFPVGEVLGKILNDEKEDPCSTSTP